jgi:hypothetical protein
MINICEDEWIPSSHSRKVLTPKGQNICTRVSDLIDPYTNSWDMDFVNQTLWRFLYHPMRWMTLWHGI